jgi:hypothetical protein
MALGFTQFRGGGKARPVRKNDLTAIFEPII